MFSESLISAIVESVFGYVLDRIDPGRRLLEKLNLDPQKLAFKRALLPALAYLEEHSDPRRDNLFSRGFMQHEAAPILADFLLRHHTPTPEDLTTAWADSIPLREPSRTEQIRAMQPLAAQFLNVLSDALKREDVLNDLHNARNFEETATLLRRIAAAQGVLPATAQTQDDYLAWLVDRNLYLDPRGTYQTQRQVMLKLEHVYVSLRAEREEDTTRVDRELLESEWAELERHFLAEGLRSEEIEDRRDQLLRRDLRRSVRQPREDAATVQLEEVAERYPLAVILGDPGSGKTTLVRFLALQAAQHILRPPRTPSSTAPLFPILLRIADYAEEDRWKDESLTDFLPNAYARQECPHTGLNDLLRTRLAEGGCLILLDGLDEIIDADHRRSIVQRIEDFVRRHQRGGHKGENRFVVTSRVAGYRTAPLGLDFVHFTVEEMNDEQIQFFLEKWCRAVEDANAPDTSEAERQRLANREIEGIMRAVKLTPGVRRLAANPLMLRTLALIHRTGAQLPQRRIELYKLAAETLERTWRTAQGISEAQLSALLRDRELPGLLGVLAYWIHANKPSGIVTEREVEGVLGQEWARLRNQPWDPHDPNPQILTEVRKFLDAVREHTGLFVERAPRRYGFMHLTFEEYYAARHLVARMRQAPKLIRQHLHNPRWQEPILLALGFLGLDYPEDAADLVETAILATSHEAQTLGFTPSQHEDLLGRDYLFALRCLADLIPVHVQTLDRLMSRLATEFSGQSPLSRFRRYDESINKRLDQLSDTPAAVSLAKHLTSALTHEDRNVRFRAADSLGRLGNSTPEMVTALKSALTDEDGDVHFSAARSLGRLGESTPGVVTSLTAALTHENRNVRLKAADSLGGLGNSTLKVITALTATLTHEDKGVRFRAAQSLVRLRYGTPEVVTVLMVALTHEDRVVRMSAAESLGQLGRIGQSTPQVVTALTAALTHEDSGVRFRAVESLRQLSSIPEVATALTAALTHEDRDLRFRAADSLGRLGNGTPEVITALTAVLTHEDTGVRFRAAQNLGQLGQSTPEVITALTAMLTHEDNGIRFRAAQSLGQLGRIGQSTPQVITALTAALTHADKGVRMSAADSLGRIGQSTPQVISSLMAMLTHADRNVCLRAADSLGQLGYSTPEMVTVLMAALTHEDRNVRFRAAQKLGQLGYGSQMGMQLYPIWQDSISDSDSWEVRRNAVRWLAQHASNVDELLPLFRQALLDNDNDVRSAAAAGLALLARRFPSHAAAIEDLLLTAITDPAFDATDRFDQRTGQDVAYDGLWQLIVGQAEDEDEDE